MLLKLRNSTKNEILAIWVRLEAQGNMHPISQGFWSHGPPGTRVAAPSSTPSTGTYDHGAELFFKSSRQDDV